MRKRKQLLRFLCLMIVMLLFNGTCVWANTGSPGKIKTVTPGTIATESSYLVPLQDGRDTLELIDTQSAEVKALQGIVASKDIQIDKLISAVEDLNRNRLQERTEWQTQIQSLHEINNKLETTLTREKHKRLTIGPFIGLAHTGEGVIGIGITYAIISF